MLPGLAVQLRGQAAARVR